MVCNGSWDTTAAPHNMTKDTHPYHDTEVQEDDGSDSQDSGSPPSPRDPQTDSLPATSPGKRVRRNKGTRRAIKAQSQAETSEQSQEGGAGGGAGGGEEIEVSKNGRLGNSHEKSSRSAAALKSPDDPERNYSLPPRSGVKTLQGNCFYNEKETNCFGQRTRAKMDVPKILVTPADDDNATAQRPDRISKSARKSRLRHACAIL